MPTTHLGAALLAGLGAGIYSSIDEISRIPYNSIDHERRHEILDLIRENGSVREHDGAFLKDFAKGVRELSLHHMENMDKKIPIGRKAAEVMDNTSVDNLILATAGISFKAGLMYPDFSDNPDDARRRFEDLGIKVILA